MCTVIFHPTDTGYALGMNRDESKRRRAANRPSKLLRNGTLRLQPLDPAGGSWIAVNEFGLSIALLNWYPKVVGRRTAGRISRGLLVDALASGHSLGDAMDQLSLLVSDRFAAFRMLAIDPQSKQVEERRWDERQLHPVAHGWAPNYWASSGFDEPEAQRVRRLTYQSRLSELDATRPGDWIRKLLASHIPERGPFSICMHRNDAQTVSATEIQWHGTRVEMAYHDGPPCLGQEWTLHTLRG